jgi:hypothetical protein
VFPVHSVVDEFGALPSNDIAHFQNLFLAAFVRQCQETASELRFGACVSRKSSALYRHYSEARLVDGMPRNCRLFYSHLGKCSANNSETAHDSVSPKISKKHRLRQISQPSGPYFALAQTQVNLALVEQILQSSQL